MFVIKMEQLAQGQKFYKEDKTLSVITGQLQNIKFGLCEEVLDMLSDCTHIMWEKQEQSCGV